MTLRGPDKADVQWLTAVHAHAQAKMLSSLLGKYRSELPEHIRDDLLKSAANRVRAILKLLEGPTSGRVPDEVWERYGWTPRTYQSKDFVSVPKAMLQEIRDSLTGGDAKALAERLVGKR